jgi:hypothetical protein
MKLSLVVPAALAAFLVGASFARADDPVSRPSTPAAAKSRVLVFGEGAARFHVERDASAGRMTFRLADPAVKLERAPVILMTTDAGPQEVALTAVDGQPSTWVWTGEAVRGERFDGTMRVFVAGKAYSAPLTTVWTTDAGADGLPKEPMVFKPRHGGRVLAFPACGANVEVLQDPATGTLTIYSSDDVVVTEAPVITITESKGPTVVTLTKVEGQPGVWMTRNETFKTTTTTASVRLLVNGKPCEAPLVYGSTHGGQIVPVTGGPSFEVVHDPKAGYYTFYAVDETYDGKTYTVENPTVVMHGRTYNLERVEGEPRAWRLVGLDTAGSGGGDGQLNFTLFGKTLSTRLGLSGFGVGVK